MTIFYPHVILNLNCLLYSVEHRRWHFENYTMEVIGVQNSEVIFFSKYLHFVFHSRKLLRFEMTEGNFGNRLILPLP